MFVRKRTLKVHNCACSIGILKVMGEITVLCKETMSTNRTLWGLLDVKWNFKTLVYYATGIQKQRERTPKDLILNDGEKAEAYSPSRQ